MKIAKQDALYYAERAETLMMGSSNVKPSARRDHVALAACVAKLIQYVRGHANG